MDIKMILIMFWVYFQSYSGLVGLSSWFFMIFRFSKFFYGASWLPKSAVWSSCRILPEKWPSSLNSKDSNWYCPKISKCHLVPFTYFPIPITLIWKRAFGAWKPYIKEIRMIAPLFECKECNDFYRVHNRRHIETVNNINVWPTPQSNAIQGSISQFTMW